MIKDKDGTTIKVEPYGEQTKLSIGSHSAFLDDSMIVELVELLMVAECEKENRTNRISPAS